MAATKILVVGIVLAFGFIVAAPAVQGDIEPFDLVERHIARPPGVEKDMTFFFGPFTIPPGQDNNRVTLDLPLHNGFFTAIAPNLVDVAEGHEPSDLHMHIHHAHWFRLSNDPSDEYYALNMAWIFGTGEEKTQGSLNARAEADPTGPRYGIYVPGGQPQALIFMLHNKGTSTENVYITLDVTFVYGAADEIRAAQGCGALLEGETCSAGASFHELKGRLWGSTFDVPRDFGEGDGVYVHPRDVPAATPAAQATNALGRLFVAPYDGTAVATAGHLHPNGLEVLIANLGPAGSGCEADLDGDGFAGITLLHSRKIERNPDVFPYSEDYQMAASKAGWRAPVRAGDRITQFGVYDNSRYASYEAMSYAGFYVDRQQAPPARGVEGCTLANTQAYIVGAPDGNPVEGVLNHEWGHAEPLCGPAVGTECHREWTPRDEGVDAKAVHIGAFAYVPGDLNLEGPMGAPPKVKQGESLLFVNDDVAIGVRHTVSSCEFPCNGPYVANYPQPDGVFDSGKLGNLDYIDGGLVNTNTFTLAPDTIPFWETPKTLEPGLYTYYCRIHPTMRGAFEVVTA